MIIIFFNVCDCEGVGIVSVIGFGYVYFFVRYEEVLLEFSRFFVKVVNEDIVRNI